MNSVGPLARSALAPRGTARRQRKASENVAAQLVNDIVSPGLVPGDSLPAEAAMMVEYQAGRGTVREALRLLEVHGLISIKTGPNGGPIVCDVTAADLARILSLYFARMNVTFADLGDARLELEPL